MTECTSQDAAMRAEFEAWAAEEWAGRSVPDNAWLGWKGAMAALQQRLAENAEIVEVYDKLHKHNVVGGHWMWGMVAQAAESGDAEQAARDHGLVRIEGTRNEKELQPGGSSSLGDQNLSGKDQRCGSDESYPAAPQASEVPKNG